MTDGILLAEIASDRWLSAYDTIIIDEAHERSLNIDFLLGYLKQLLREAPRPEGASSPRRPSTPRASPRISATRRWSTSKAAAIRSKCATGRWKARARRGKANARVLDGIVAACDEIAREDRWATS